MYIPLLELDEVLVVDVTLFVKFEVIKVVEIKVVGIIVFRDLTGEIE